MDDGEAAFRYKALIPSEVPNYTITAGEKYEDIRANKRPFFFPFAE